MLALFSDVPGPGLVLPREVIAANLSKGSTALDFGINMVVPIPDLQVDELGIRGTLSFSRVPFHVSVPWRFVIGIQLLDGDGKPAKPAEPSQRKRWLVDVTADIPFDPRYQDAAHVPETVAPPALRLLSEAVVAGGDIAAKRWADGPPWSWNLAVAMLAYVAVSAAWLVVLKLNGGALGRAAVIWASTGVVTPMLLGRFMFAEPVLPQGWVGMVFCAIGNPCTKLFASSS